MYGSSRETKVPEFGDESQSSVREESGYLDLSSSLCWKDTSDLPQSTESPLPAIDEERDEDDEGNDV